MPQTSTRNLYGEVDNATDLRDIFLDIRKDVDGAKSRKTLTELYKRAGYLITLTYAPSWDEKFGSKAKSLRAVAEEEFGRTARKINRRARDIGEDGNYDEKWGK